jgi:lipoprotein-releasing system ATP-binding protein
MSECVLQAQHLSRHYQQGQAVVPVLHDIELQVHAGQTVAITGSSGSGKSTLMHLLAGLDAPDQGKIWWDGVDIATCSAAELGRRRNHHLGFVFQFHHLLSEFDALDNVAMPLWVRRCPTHEAQVRALQALTDVGMAHRIHHRPAELSGGERQRVALARALVAQPRCILADEPTGNLDRETADHMFDLLVSLCRRHGMALLLVTHDEDMAQRCDRQLKLQLGRLLNAA